MAEQLLYMLDALKNEIREIQALNTDVLTYVPISWRGEASMEYINALCAQDENVMDIIRRIEELKEKVIVFKSDLSYSDTLYIGSDS